MSTLQKAVVVAGQSGCQVSDTVHHSASMPVSLLTHQDSTACDSGSESMAYSDTDNEMGSSIKETLLNIKALNGEAGSISRSKGQLQQEEETNGVNSVPEKDKVCEEDSVVVSSGEEDSPADVDKSHEDEGEEEEAEKVRTEMEEDKLLTDSKEELTSEAPVNEDEEFRLLMDVDEEGAQDKRVSEELDGMDTVRPDEDDPVADRVTSPCPDSNLTSESGSKMEADASSKVSDCESLSSSLSESKKHPLFIRKNVKYSFKGIMTTAVKRVSHDSDSIKSLSPTPEDNSKPSSPKPDSSVTSVGSSSVSDGADIPADSSTMPDDRNLFEKLNLLTDSGKEDTDVDMDQGSDSQISTSKASTGVVCDNVGADEDSERNDTPVCSVDEPMEMDSPKVATEDSNSRLSPVSTTSTDVKEESCGSEVKGDCAKDTCETSQDSDTKSGCSDKACVSRSSRSRSQSPACSLSDFDKAKLVGPPGKCTEVTAKAVVKAECDSKSSNVDDSGVTDDVGDNKDTNLLCKVEEPKDEGTCSTEEMKIEVKNESETPKVESSGDHPAETEGGDSECSDRKRSAGEDTEDSKPKRSRLDFVIGKLGTQIGISPENIKCDEIMFDSDIESGKTSSDSTENRSEEVTSEDDEAASRSQTTRLTEESLDELIKRKIKEVLEQQKEVLTKQFQDQLNELQASNEAWKSKAKELHRQAVDLMSHQQRQERRRAVRASGQRRNVGIQVGEERINSLSQQTTSKAGLSSAAQAVSAGSQTNPTPVSLLCSKQTTVPTPTTAANRPPTNQVLVQRMPMPTYAVRKDLNSTVKSILNNNRIGQLGGISTQPLTPVTQPSQGKVSTAVGKPAASPAAGTVGQSPGVQAHLVKVIDLTSDEENSSAKTAASRPVAGQSLLGAPGYRPATTTTTTLQPGTRILLSPGTGTPFISNQPVMASAQPRQAGVQYQYLYAPSNQPVTAGNVVTLVSPPAGTSSTGVRPAAPAPPQLTRPAQPAATRPPQTTTTTTRAPPPLQSAPTKPTPSAAATVKDKAEPKSVPSEPLRKSPELPKHPAPLPALPANQDMSSKKKALPPKPGLKISRVSQGIVLSWNMLTSSNHADIASYQLFAYQETSAPLSSNLWKKVGDVKALPLPMACTLTQFQEGNKYHFAVRAVDVHGRMSVFSDPSTIHLVVQNSK